MEKYKMKQFIAAVALMFAATTAFAGAVSVGTEYEFFNGKNGAVDYNGFAVVPAYTVGSVILDAKLQTARTGDGKIFNTVEARAKYEQAIADKLVASVRVGYGSMFYSNGSTEFYTIEPAVRYAVTPELTAGVSYRFRNELSGDQTRRALISADYAVTSNTTIGVEAFRETGDVDGNGFHLSVARAF